MFPRYLIPALILALLPVSGVADGGTIDTVPEGAWVKVPANAMTMEKVEHWFGPPARKFPPVGDPPITRWEYPDYIVYFEYDKVITSVYKRK